MLPLFAILALAGLAKSATIDRQKEERDQKLASETQRYSPWTGLKANPIQRADPLGSALQGGMAGLQLDQNMKSQAQSEKLNNSMSGYYDRMGSGGSTGGGTADVAGATQDVNPAAKIMQAPQAPQSPTDFGDPTAMKGAQTVGSTDPSQSYWAQMRKLGYS